MATAIQMRMRTQENRTVLVKNPGAEGDALEVPLEAQLEDQHGSQCAWEGPGVEEVRTDRQLGKGLSVAFVWGLVV